MKRLLLGAILLVTTILLFTCINNNKYNLTYPLLAMWWPNSWEQSVTDLARYDYIGWGEWENEKTLSDLKKRNPHQLHFTAINITETSWDAWEDEHSFLREIPDKWFLTQVGSTLKNDVNTNQTDIAVNETKDKEGNPLFEEGDTVTCGFESMKIISVNHDDKILMVERGFVRLAGSHNAGERIAAHITFWPLTWVMNISTLCPTYDIGKGPETWVDWALRKLPIQWPDQRDGFLIDRVEDSQGWLADPYEGVARNIDPDCSNTLLDNYEELDSAWYNGIREFLPRIRNMLNGKPLFGNTFGAYSDLLNGSIWESCPGNWSDTIPETYEDWADRVLGDEGYIEVSQKGYAPNFSLVETYELEEYLEDPASNNPANNPDFVPNYQRMRFGLTTALLGDGYFSYEINTNGHGTLGLMWFDEYDNAGAGRGYLGYPFSDTEVIFDFGNDGKVFRRDFEGGIVICNPSGREVTVPLGDYYRLINGTQVPAVNTGKTINSITIPPNDGRILLNPDPDG